MRKANQPNSAPAEFVADERSLELAVTHMDVAAKNRNAHQVRIDRAKRNIRDIKQNITRMSRDIRNISEEQKRYEVELAAMPVATMTVEDVKKQFDGIIKLPWVEKVVLLDGIVLLIDVRPGVLKTTFYDRVVYKGGQRVNELLHRPLSLPMPTYQIQVNVQNMGNSWHRNPSLSIRLKDPKTLKFNHPPNELGLTQAASAHWATHENQWHEGRGEAEWSDLCLEDYRGILVDAAKEGLPDLLNAVAVFLQESGWARAYRTKIAWFSTLGFEPYYVQLIRPLQEGETFEQIQASNRNRMSSFLQENGLTQHIYDYGSPAEGEVDTRSNMRAQQLREMVLDSFGAVPRRNLPDAFFTYGEITLDEPRLMVDSDEIEPPNVPF